ncbi:MAG: endonuclease/exonuclease/phosphatase family protein [Rhodobacteraceae bacterium]|nr:endonuclease/exonuclease/phosphatase family protein [Paracoccaceae bacterium]
MGLERPGPGLLLQDIDRGTDPQIAAALAVLIRLDADILVLTAVDHDPALLALRALARRLADQGLVYPHLHAPRPNSGQPTGHDANGNGTTHDPADAQGWGRFPGAGGSAILSRLPLLTDRATDHSAFLWRDLPGHLMPPTDPALATVQRLASHSHLQLPVALPNGETLTLLIWHATPPVFDGPEDRNGRRNHDEAAFWLRLLDGSLPSPPPQPPFLLIGDANLDPADGDGLPGAMTALLTHPMLQDPAPRGSHGRSEPAHAGDPALDTVLYPALGGLRLDYILPSRDLAVAAAGVLWPPAEDPFAATLAAASRHAPVWVDVALPAPAPP